MRTALVQLHSPDTDNAGDMGFLVLEKFPEGSVRIVNDYVFDLDKTSYHDIVDMLSVKLHDRGFDEIFLENTRTGKIIPFTTIRNRRSKERNLLENQLRNEFCLKPEHARLMSNKIYVDKDLLEDKDQYRCDPREEYDKKRNALFMSNPEKYSKMLRKKKRIKPKTKRKVCRCKK
jgi:hypothetical protein